MDHFKCKQIWLYRRNDKNTCLLKQPKKKSSKCKRMQSVCATEQTYAYNQLQETWSVTADVTLKHLRALCRCLKAVLSGAAETGRLQTWPSKHNRTSKAIPASGCIIKTYVCKPKQEKQATLTWRFFAQSSAVTRTDWTSYTSEACHYDIIYIPYSIYKYTTKNITLQNNWPQS